MEAGKLYISSSEISNGKTDHHDAGHHSNGSTVQQQKQKPASSVIAVSLNGSDYAKLLVCAGCGFIFGIAAEKGKIYVPSVIQQQMLFAQNAMLKAFLTAVTSSVVMFSGLYILPSTRALFNQVRIEFGGCVNTKRVVAFATGGLILGMGMTVSGACPGMVMVQAGAGLEKSLITLLGCFTGAMLYGAVEPSLRRHISSKTHSHLLKSIWLDKILGIPYLAGAVGLAIMIGVVVLAAETLVPWTHDSVPLSAPGTSLMEQKSWSPIMAGLLMGSMQLPVALVVKDSLGGSSSYCTVISQSRRLSQAIPYFSSYSRGGLANWWQVFYWGGAVGGAALSAYASGMWGMSSDMSNTVAFAGGVLMLFGARLASGCTSGHGLSGLALLSLSSFVAVPAMFAGGISLAFARKLLF